MSFERAVQLASPEGRAPRSTIPMDKSITPKASLLIKDIGNGMKASDAVVAGSSTIRMKRDKVNASLAFTDSTLKDVRSLRDTVATVDYKAAKAFTVNGKYELGSKKYLVGGTWDSVVAKKPATVKLWYTNKDDLLAGDVTAGLAKGQKANVTFNQQKLLAARYTLTKGDYIFEPSYSFVKKSPAVALTRKLNLRDTMKLSYDVKSEVAVAEWARKPFKVSLMSIVSKQLTVGRPTLAATWEQVYDL